MTHISKLISAIAIFIPFAASAEPTSDSAVNITQIRPYLNGAVYVHVDSTAFCNTSVFVIGSDVLGKDEMYSAALSALVASKKIRLEALTATGCNGWGTQLQSIYLQAN